MNLENYSYEDPNTHEQAVDQYLANLKAFLMSPDHGDGSWPDIKPEALKQAQELMLDMLQLKWGHDCDSDRPVRLRLWYRRTHRLLADWAFLDVDHRERNVSPIEAEGRLLANLRTISSVMGSAAEEMRMAQNQLEEMHRRKLREAASMEVFLIRYEKNESWLAGEHLYDLPASLHFTKEAADSFVAEGFAVERKLVKRAMPTDRDNPAGDYAEFRKKLEALCGKVLPFHAELSMYLAS